jgi:uncharacterized membrane protein HdeD (DUF308 family)
VESPSGRMPIDFQSLLRAYKAAGEDKRKWGDKIIYLGVALVILGIVVLVVPVYEGATVQQLNGLCSSGIGMIGQAFSQSLSDKCGLAGIADQSIGWLIGGGITLAVAGITIRFT